MSHGSIEAFNAGGIGFDVDPECEVNRMPPLKVEKRATTGRNSTKITKQVGQITGIVLQFQSEKDKQLLYDLHSSQISGDLEFQITFSGNQTLYVNGTFDISDGSSQDGSVGIVIDPTVPDTWG